MIIATDINGLVYKANPTYSADDYSQASGVYEINTAEKTTNLLLRPLSDFTILQTITTESGTFDLMVSIKSHQTAEINTACRTEIVSGFDSDALGTTHTYPSKEEDQTNLMATFVLAKELNASKPFKCWDAAGVADYRVHTVAQLHQAGQDAETHKMAALVKANTLKAQIAAATTLAEIEAIVW